MSIEDRVKAQFPALFVTLMSVLVGLFFADLVSQAQARMTLWPLNAGVLRTWGQIAAMAANALAIWVIYSHIGIARQQVASLSDSVIAFAAPIPLLIANGFVGRADFWPWLYFAGAYLLVSLLAIKWLIRMACEEHESFARLNRPTGAFSILYFGIPTFLVLGWLDQHGWISPWLEVFIAANAIPAPVITAHLFLKDWQWAVAEASK